MTRGVKVAGISAGAVVLLGVAIYLLGYFITGDRVPRHVTVAGVSVGGMSREDAIAALESELAPMAEDPIELSVNGEKDTLDPADAGLSVDYEASVEAAGIGKSFDPRRMVQVLTGGQPVEPVIVADQQKLDQAVAQLSEEYDVDPRNAKVTLKDAEIKNRKMRTGVDVDQSGAAKIISTSLLSEQPVTVPVELSKPEITDDEVEELIKDRLEPALSGPITVSVGEAGEFELGAQQIAAALKIKSVDGAPTATLQGEKLHEIAEDEISDLDIVEPKDATVKIVDGKPKVIEGEPGGTVTAKSLAAAVDQVLTAEGSDRTAAVELTGADPEFDAEAAKELGITEVIGEFTTQFPYAEYRNTNIGRAAEKINNTLLKPDEVFSLNRVVGERTAENGFVAGSIISGGKFKEELGGGVSQSATTTYNAMFFAGLEDIQHQPHTLYIDRYPAGREATVAWPTVDLKFRNNTEYGVLVQTLFKDSTPGERGSITVKMWSTETYDKIESSELKKSNFTYGQDIKDDSPDCVPTSPVQGFDVDYSRLFYRDGKVVKTEDFSWRYAPTDQRTCV